MNPVEVAELSRLLDEVQALEAALREPWLVELERTRPHAAQRLRDMLRQSEAQDHTAVLPQLASIDVDDAVATAGERVGSYRLVREIGRGGMGTVWLGERDDGEDRIAALKLPRVQWGLERRLDERLQRESNALARLKHPNIARLYEAGITAQGHPYLALEYVEGQTVDRYCRSSAFRLDQTLQLMVRVIRAVAYAHSRLVVHRDLKPSNILVAADGTPKLLDFGIAKILEEDAQSAYATELTRFAGRPLTLAYAAPEQILGEQITVATDIYSLGVILFELVTESRPYLPKGTTPEALKAEVLAGSIRQPSAAAIGRTRASALRGDLDSIILRALRRRPDERYETAAALAEDLENYLRGTRVLARPDSKVGRLMTLAKRNTAGIGVALSALLIVGAAFGGSWWEANLARERADRATQIHMVLLLLAQQAESDSSPRKKMTDLARIADLEEKIERDFRDNADELLQLRVSLAEVYLAHAQPEEARRVFRRAADEAARRAPPNNPFLLRAREGSRP